MNSFNQIYLIKPEQEITQKQFFPEGTPAALDEVSAWIPQGAYTTFRTYDRVKIYHLEEHFKRLEQTAQLNDQTIVLDRVKIRVGLRKLIGDAPGSDVRIRITLDLSETPGDVYLAKEPLHAPSRTEIKEGVKAITRRMHRSNPRAKLTNFIKDAELVREGKPQWINEVLMVGEDGSILEGLSSNFFGVIEGEIWTADEGVLEGLTRKLTIEEARLAGVAVHLAGVPTDQVPFLQECWITSASRCVLPVVQIDDRAIGSGKPGTITRLLQKSVRERVLREAEPV